MVVALKRSKALNASLVRERRFFKGTRGDRSVTFDSSLLLLRHSGREIEGKNGTSLKMADCPKTVATLTFLFFSRYCSFVPGVHVKLIY